MTVIFVELQIKTPLQSTAKRGFQGQLVPVGSYRPLEPIEREQCDNPGIPMLKPLDNSACTRITITMHVHYH